MKRKWLLIVVVLLLALPLGVSAERYQLSNNEYAVYYEVCDYLFEDWDSPLWDLLDEVSYDYGMTPDEMYEFLEYAVFVDSDHVWVPVYGGTKFHTNADCSKMIEPRPTTKDVAYEYGYTPCGRCKPGR